MKIVVLKYSLLLPVLLFSIWVGLTLFGCVSCFFDVGDDYYCTSYCVIAKISITIVLGGYLILFARAILKNRNGE